MTTTDSSAHRAIQVRMINYGIENHKRVKREGPVILDGKIDPDMGFTELLKLVMDNRAEVIMSDPPKASAASPKKKTTS